MRSQLKSSPTAKEKLRAQGVSSTVELTNPGMERLNGLISKMGDLFDELIYTIVWERFEVWPQTRLHPQGIAYKGSILSAAVGSLSGQTSMARP